MHAAPPVELPLAAGRIERVLIALLYAGAAAVAVHWACAQWATRDGDAVAMPPWAAGAAALAAALLAGLLGHAVGRALLPPAPGRLRWTGTVWQLDGIGRAAATGHALPTDVQLDLQIDTQRWVLLRWRSGTARGWAVAGAASAGAAWHGLRVALQAHAGHAAAESSIDRPVHERAAGADRR